MAAVFHHDGRFVIALHVRQRFREHASDVVRRNGHGKISEDNRVERCGLAPSSRLLASRRLSRKGSLAGWVEPRVSSWVPDLHSPHPAGPGTGTGWVGTGELGARRV